MKQIGRCTRLRLLRRVLLRPGRDLVRVGKRTGAYDFELELRLWLVANFVPAAFAALYLIRPAEDADSAIAATLYDARKMTHELACRFGGLPFQR